MPRKDVHDIFEKNLLGYITGMTEKMDAPSQWLHGQHREVLHTIPDVLILAGSIGGSYSDNVQAGLLHLFLDGFFSDGKKMLKKYYKKEWKGKKNDRRRHN